ncbi:70 kDa peptidyl-prolyl isomerase [Trifolium pratense]|uniref:70 kDa peptidyl-prolyl isomerase n=1 Tax=Trifolium pratense TaxID=57577 RepID=A0A2K3N215_TRIPR|nr:70 kDa peptidyl-prolyl isomerase [Trifolium pratense]
MPVDDGGLWFRVLEARYGIERGCLQVAGKGGEDPYSIVWIRDGADGLGGRWFGESVLMRVGDGTVNRSSAVAELFALGWGLGREAWEWQKQLWPDLSWHKQIPLKVSVFAWRLMRDKLPTKSNLVARGIILPEVQSCVSDCGEVESAQHLFISCSTFDFLWSSVRSWIDFSSVDPQNMDDRYLQFTFSPGGLIARRSFLQLI